MADKHRLIIEKGYDEEIASQYREQLHQSGVPCLDYSLATCWGEAARSGKGAQVCRYTLLDDGKVVGLFQGVVEKVLVVSNMVAGATGGDGVSVLPECGEGALAGFLSQVVGKERSSVTQLYVPCSVALERFSASDRHTFQIDLRAPAGAMMANMEQRTRYTVRKVEKSGVEVRIEKDDSALAAAYELIVATANTREFALPHWNHIREIHSHFNRDGDSICVLAYFEGRLVSAAHFLGYDRKLNWISGGSSEHGYRLNAMSLVQMHAIEWARTQGYLVYDMGGTNPADPALEGIHRFKRGFGGKLVTSSVLLHTSWYFPVLKAAKKMVDAARKRSYEKDSR